MRMDFLGLEAFLAIAERGNFLRAAAHLNLSQTALSHRMKKLEDDLGLKLLTRSTRQVALTEAGLELLPNARRMLDEMEASYEALRRQGRARRETVSIACLPTVATHVLPRVLAAFTLQFPAMTVRVFDDASDDIADRVQAGQAEFGITIVSANRQDLEIKPLMKDPYVLLCRRDHALAGSDAVNWADLDRVPLVRVSSSTGNRGIIDDALGRRREQMRWQYEVQHLAAAISLVRGGIALTIAPRLAVDFAAMPELVGIPVRTPVVTRTLGIVTRRGAPASPAGDVLRALFATEMRRDGPGGDNAPAS